MKFYNNTRLLNTKSNFCFCVGSRSAGKTYSFKKTIVDYFKEHGKKFVFLRRYLSEVDFIKDTLFNDLQEYNITVNGYDIFLDDVHCGIFLSLSSILKYKSVNMSDYKYIVFDEFLPEDKKYLGLNKGYHYEPNLCLNFFQSVARGYNTPYREEVQFILVSNNVSLTNPYFNFFQIEDKILNKQKFINNGFVSYEDTTLVNEEFKQSAFYKFAINTEYGQYAFKNEALTNNNNFIGKAPINSRYIANLDLYNITFSIKFDVKNGVFYIDKDYNPNFKKWFSVVAKNNRCFLMTSSLFKVLKKSYLNGCLYFSNQKAKTLIYYLE